MPFTTPLILLGQMREQGSYHKTDVLASGFVFGLREHAVLRLGHMNTTELTKLLKGEKDFFESQPDISEIILYGSAMSEDEIREDVDVLVVPSREMLPGELVDLRQVIWEHLKDRISVALDVQATREDLNKETLSENDVQMTSIFVK